MLKNLSIKIGGTGEALRNAEVTENERALDSGQQVSSTPFHSRRVFVHKHCLIARQQCWRFKILHINCKLLELNIEFLKNIFSGQTEV